MAIETNKFDDAKLAEIRVEQGDPIIMYFIVREDLGMGVGKIAAQCAHGAQMVLLCYNEKMREFGLFKWGKYGRLCVTMKKWLDGSFRKVVLKADAKEFEKVKNDEKLDLFVVKDAGLTEVECGSETVLVAWPIMKSEAGKTVLKRLRVL